MISSHGAVNGELQKHLLRVCKILVSVYDRFYFVRNSNKKSTIFSFKKSWKC